MNPFIFIPSPRDIPEVKKQWHTWNYDVFVVKYMAQKEAYALARETFLEHPEYDRFVIVPDDNVLTKEQLDQLLEDSEKFEVIDAICPVDETSIAWDVQPLGCNLNRLTPEVHYGAWYTMDGSRYQLPDEHYLQVGHSGAAGRVMSRELFEKISFTGSENGEGWFDYQMSKEFTKMGVPIMVNTHIVTGHLRNHTKVNKEALRENNMGYSFWIRR